MEVFHGGIHSWDWEQTHDIWKAAQQQQSDVVHVEFVIIAGITKNTMIKIMFWTCNLHTLQSNIHLWVAAYCTSSTMLVCQSHDASVDINTSCFHVCQANCPATEMSIQYNRGVEADMCDTEWFQMHSDVCYNMCSTYKGHRLLR